MSPARFAPSVPARAHARETPRVLGSTASPWVALLATGIDLGRLETRGSSRIDLDSGSCDRTAS